MKILKWVVGSVLALYIVFVVLFEAVFLGYYQPKLEATGIPMLLLTTTDESGEATSRRLARFEMDGKIYVSAHHWPRGWYHEAVNNPLVQVVIEGGEEEVEADYLAVPVEGEEFEVVADGFRLGFVTRFLMGFPPERDILRLDPVVPVTETRPPNNLFFLADDLSSRYRDRF